MSKVRIEYTCTTTSIAQRRSTSLPACLSCGTTADSVTILLHSRVKGVALFFFCLFFFPSPLTLIFFHLVVEK